MKTPGADKKRVNRGGTMIFPEKIRAYVKDSAFRLNDVGMSGSQVYVFDKYVLKVQPVTAETDNEYEILKWLAGRCPTPSILEYVKEDETSYTLMTKAAGKMLCDDVFMQDPEKLTDLIAQGIRMLWNVDIQDCPCSCSRLSERLKAARENIENGEVNLENAEPETFGQGGFTDPAELLVWLETHQPEEDLVLTHGDLCLPNLFSDGEKITAFIDNGKMGPADRWQDLAVVLRSLRHNFGGKYTGVPYGGYREDMLLKKLGMEMDEEKNRYYLLLDELF